MKKLFALLIIIGVTLIGLILGYFRISEYIFKQQELKSLNSNGGAEITIQVDMTNIPPNKKSKIFSESKNILFRRIRLFGFYPFIQDSSDYKMVIQLANVGNLDALANIIGITANLSFWEGKDTTSSAEPVGMKQVFPSGATQTELTGMYIQNAKVVFDPKTNAPQVQIGFTPEGSRLFADITKRNIGKPIAIVLDNQVIEAPVVNQPILIGNAVLSGNLTKEQAENLSIQLDAGAIPAPITVLEKHYIKAKVIK